MASPSATSTPPVTIKSELTPTYDFHFDFQSPVAATHARHGQSPFMLATPASKKHAALAHPLNCTFEALALHFHLPLKVAAEKFGVRATAFKKRCRAIGIRHWPYRKVRSLKRSLQDLARCKEEGPLTDKQTTQQAAYQKQLDKLLSPETYGIDPTSGRLLPGFHDDDDDENDSDDDDDNDSTCGSHSSPSHLNSPYSRCSSARSPYKPRGVAHSPFRATRGRPPMGLNQSTHFFYNMVHSGGNANDYLNAPTLNDAATMPSVSVRFATHAGHGGSGMPFEAYDPFFGDFKGGEYSLTMEDFGDEDHPSCGYALEGISTHDDDFFPMIRSPTMAMRRAHMAMASSSIHDEAQQQVQLHQMQPQAQFQPQTQQRSRDAESMEDDVFLQITPDIGCLV